MPVRNHSKLVGFLKCSFQSPDVAIATGLSLPAAPHLDTRSGQRLRLRVLGRAAHRKHRRGSGRCMRPLVPGAELFEPLRSGAQHVAWPA